nr:MAG: nucleotide sugar dehydrogenase [Pseudomonadota bacterium]
MPGTDQDEPRARVEAYLGRVDARETLVGVIGMGYVGLPLALAFVEAGFRVMGFDTDPEKVEKLNRGEGYIQHLQPERIRLAAQSGKLVASSDLTRLGEPDTLLITVPTPLTRQREPDMRYIVETAEAISKALRPGQLVVLESTTYPGTTEELVLPILERSGLRSGRDFFVAFSPEREDPGNRDYGTRDIPKVVGGVGEDALRMAQRLYSAVIRRTVAVPSARVAEAVKLTENIFRAVNIALVNELKIIYERMGIDVWDVLDAASTKPFGFMRFNPGPGLGGHCIPIDPFYLTWKAREYGLSTRFIELAGEINVGMPRYVVEKLQLALNDRGKALKDAKVLILGVAYKKDIDDPRESPAFELMHLLGERGAQVRYHDPHIPVLPSLRSWPHLGRLESVPLTGEVLSAQDAVLIATDHSAVDYGFVLEKAPLIVDTRGVYRTPAPNVIKA